MNDKSTTSSNNDDANNDGTTRKRQRRRLSRQERKALKKKKKKPTKSCPIPPLPVGASPSSKHRRNDGTSFEVRDNSQQQEIPCIPTAEELNESYIPTPIPTLEELQSKHSTTSLGKWFPKAVVQKSSIHYTNADVLKFDQKANSNTKGNNINDPTKHKPKASILLFYQYVEYPLWSASQVDLLIAYLLQIHQHRSNVGGRIRVAREGVNVTLSAVDDITDATTSTTKNNATAVTTLRHFVMDLQRFDPTAFRDTDFKYIDGLQADRHFKDLKIYPVQELVYYGFKKNEKSDQQQQQQNDPAPLDQRGVHLPPKQFHAMLQQDPSTTVVIDVRNHYEAVLGRFDGQMQGWVKGATTTITKNENGNDNNQDDGAAIHTRDSNNTELTDSSVGITARGAEYIDPKMRKSTDFAKWLSKDETKEKLHDKNVLLFCTGGVRCERASAYLRTSLGSDHVKGVYQLHGGIERYLQEFPDGGYWRGKNFVFDKREAFGVEDRNGDGGVIGSTKNKKNSNNKTKSLLETVESKCCLCSKHWDRYVGKKKCSTCGVPVLMCDSCLSDKRRQQEQLIRCPLCVEENVTVRVEDVDWTNNGVDIQEGSLRLRTTDDEKESGVDRKVVASSVLKWGGGHAAKKKDRRKFQTIPCKFGRACSRQDCFFAHPTSC